MMRFEATSEQFDKIIPDGLNQLWDGGEDAKVDIVFVHGLRGDPQKTWEACDADGDRVFWPKELLPSTIPESRIFSFGYPTEFATFYPVIKADAVAHTNIDIIQRRCWSNLEIVGEKLPLYASFILPGVHTDTTAIQTSRPIIFVAHSLGGLVVANGLSSQSGSNEQRQEVINNTCGTIFLGTPFKGSDKASWAGLAEKVLSMLGDSNDQIIKDLDKNSTKLQHISTDFHLLLKQRYESKELNPIQVACFFETKSTMWKKKKDLGLIVTKQSAAIAGYQPMPIHADHRAMCRFTDAQTTGYVDATQTMKLMVENWGQKNVATEVSLGNVEQGANVLNYGIITGHVVATVKNANNLSVSHTFNSIGQGTAASDAVVRAWAEKQSLTG
ncbi:hypothetical protein BU23DRAFT_573272 [Bimuria novae-zelandiae CBS 107.79]|uniref:DUF676 domain-containing protein n=1 Tax=Bimuria novae-zelandiae CBS 107.79 TaxID=1447943 RepID=A0A6A5UR78_9PLEO|nr:hypothetical protein BU23DRAFT_573272 [Bimuria novae-zelandiae CBS 107.79]